MLLALLCSMFVVMSGGELYVVEFTCMELMLAVPGATMAC